MSRVTLAKPMCRPKGVLDVGNRNDGPERRPALPHSAYLRLETTLFQRDPKSALRLARRQVLGGVEAGDVLADDLLGLVALALLGPRIPTRDVPGRVEHEDAVILHRLHQQPERVGTRVIRRGPIRRVIVGLIVHRSVWHWRSCETYFRRIYNPPLPRWINSDATSPPLYIVESQSISCQTSPFISIRSGDRVPSILGREGRAIANDPGGRCRRNRLPRGRRTGRRGGRFRGGHRGGCGPRRPRG